MTPTEIEAGDERRVLEALASRLFGSSYADFNWPRFDWLLDLEAHLNAAMMLLEPHTLWAVGSMEEGPFARLVMPQADGGYVGGYVEAYAPTPALALCAAIARAGGEQT
jgi:hypothetical protein